jgi:ornithine decarboxylase
LHVVTGEFIHFAKSSRQQQTKTNRDMGGGSRMQTVLLAPGVKDKKLLSYTRRNALKEKDAVTDLIRSIIATSSPVQRTAFHVFRIDNVLELYSAWRRGLPDVRPYYAVKCNPEPALLGALAELGAGFDCASRAEIEAVLALGVPPSSIIYANPCKSEPHLEYAAAAGVNLTTYDTEEEVAKVKRCHPRCELLLRLKGPDGSETTCDLGTKYGARADEVVPLLRAVQRAGVTVAGVSFHVGSPVARVGVYRAAIEAARAAFDEAAALGMPPMRVLDIGGGFTAGASFDDAAAVINDALARSFGDLPCVEVIGEPGRYFCETAFTLAARVIGKRTRGEVREYWIDDGLYGSLNNILMDHKVPRPRPLATPRPGDRTHTSTVFGPTCDSQDEVVTGYQLPEMSVGDWLVFDNMGAYSTGSGSKFNGFDTSEIKIYVAYSS